MEKLVICMSMLYHVRQNEVLSTSVVLVCCQFSATISVLKDHFKAAIKSGNYQIFVDIKTLNELPQDQFLKAAASPKHFKAKWLQVKKKLKYNKTLTTFGSVQSP